MNKKFLFGLITSILMVCTWAIADNISAPPPIKDADTFHYLRQVYENLHRLQVVTTTPSGSRNGKRGDMVLLQTGGSSYLMINTDSSTTWLGEQLSIVP